MLNITMGTDDVTSKLAALALKNMPFAAQRTVNDLAFLVRDNTYGEMRGRFDRPTPFTLRSMEVIKSKSKAAPTAWVGLRLDAPQQRALAHEFTGGDRRFKRMEGAFRNIGVLPPGLIVVPGAGCPLTAYGNPQPGFITRMLAYFRALGEQGYQANMTDKTKRAFERKLSKKAGGGVQFFLGNGRSLHLGIWQRIGYSKGSAIKPILMFVGRGHYQRRIDLERISHVTLSRHGAKILTENLAKAIATSR